MAAATSTDILLHHYPGSPFAEKIRLLLGYSGLPWYSVEIPPVIPKPDVIALTGGYRKTPLLQIGADVFCDTQIIAQVIEKLSGTDFPTLYPKELAGSIQTLSIWADTTLFGTTASYLFQPAGAAVIFAGATPEYINSFRTDRQTFTAGMPRPTFQDAEAQLSHYYKNFDNQLASGNYILGTTKPTIADFSLYHNIWFVKRVPALAAALLDPLNNLAQWYDKMVAIGHGKKLGTIDSKDAVKLAHDSTPGAANVWPEHDNFSVAFHYNKNDKINVAPTDYGIDPVEGEFVSSGENHIAVRRTDERAGTVHVHFPRIGYKISKL